ncbi:MAG TPA: hypothetical protein VKY40_04335 [Halanaerobiales bacterium]|nr:hypothetical protein [Halanaerobiales bacterium]
MSDYKETIDKYKNKLLVLENVVGVGYGLKKRKGKKTGERAIMVLVENKVPVKKLEDKDLVPKKIEDYRTDVIEIGSIKLLNLEDRRVRVRPAHPGVSIGHYKVSAGTLGAIVRDKISGKLMMLSNNHVLANVSNGYDQRASIGDPVLQPGIYDDGNEPDDVIAYLERFIPLKRGDEEPQCNVALMFERVSNSFLHLLKPDYNFRLYKNEGSNLVDCALARPKSEEMVALDILEIGRVKGVREPEVNLRVQKSGRTTGLTTGEVISVGATLSVNMSETEKATFEDQFITTPISKAGDSGSLVLDMRNYATGLLFAGSEKATVCNRISNVLDMLKIEFQEV